MEKIAAGSLDIVRPSAVRVDLRDDALHQVDSLSHREDAKSAKVKGKE